MALSNPQRTAFVVLVAIALGLGILLIKCQFELESCCEGEDLADAQPLPDDFAFRFGLDNDGYGTFMPINNQFKDQHGLPYFGGYLVQLGTLAVQGHKYTHIQIERESGPDTGNLCEGRFECWGKQEVKWIDIGCGQGHPAPITKEQAQLLIPSQVVAGQVFEAEPGAESRLIHMGMDKAQFIGLVTIWQGAQGLQVNSSSHELSDNPQAQTYHGHDMFEFYSKDSCEIRFWTDLNSDTYSEIFPPGDSNPVIGLRVIATTAGSDHGSVHMPPWE